jgi:hypothetical protein
MQNYHTGKEPIIVREFGRNFQKMILFTKDLPIREQRQATMERIVDLILEMYPVTYRNVDDYKVKIWSHILQICNYELDLDIPENVPARKEKIKPDKVPYSTGTIRFKHYGKGIERLIDKASEMEDDERRQELIRVIGAFMKMCYKNWNRDNASDDVVAQEMRTLSRGRINLGESANINFLIQPQTKVSGGNSITNQQKKIGSGKHLHHRKPGPYNKGNQGGQQGGGLGTNQGGQGNTGNNNRFKRPNGPGQGGPQGGPGQGGNQGGKQGPQGPGGNHFKKKK